MDSFYNPLHKCDSSTFLFKGIREREKRFNIYQALRCARINTVLSILSSHFIFTLLLRMVLVSPLFWLWKGGFEGFNSFVGTAHSSTSCALNPGLVMVLVMVTVTAKVAQTNISPPPQSPPHCPPHTAPPTRNRLGLQSELDELFSTQKLPGFSFILHLDSQFIVCHLKTGILIS